MKNFALIGAAGYVALRHLFKQGLALPLYEKMQPEQIRFVAENLKTVLV